MYDLRIALCTTSPKSYTGTSNWVEYLLGLGVFYWNTCLMSSLPSMCRGNPVYLIKAWARSFCSCFSLFSPWPSHGEVWSRERFPRVLSMLSSAFLASGFASSRWINSALLPVDGMPLALRRPCSSSTFNLFKSIA